MSFLDLFFSSSAKKLEQKGDTFFEDGLWGQAKQAYERALDKLEINSGQSPDDHMRLTEKIVKVREALVREHQQNAQNYLDGEFFDEARQLLILAHEVSSDEKVKNELEQKLRDIDLRQSRNILNDTTDYFYGLEDEDQDDDDDDDMNENDFNKYPKMKNLLLYAILCLMTFVPLTEIMVHILKPGMLL
jgi:tetratricopeptide (TPR) repeat protein